MKAGWKAAHQERVLMKVFGGLLNNNSYSLTIFSRDSELNPHRFQEVPDSNTFLLASG